MGYGDSWGKRGEGYQDYDDEPEEKKQKTLDEFEEDFE